MTARLALMNKCRNALGFATTEVGRKDAWSVCGVGATAVASLKTWEGEGGPAQWAEMSRTCAPTKQAIFLHLAAFPDVEDGAPSAAPETVQARARRERIYKKTYEKVDPSSRAFDAAPQPACSTPGRVRRQV